jgi:hypothetical protein
MIPLGFELGSGAQIFIPQAHAVFIGQTQRAGKTTALEACAVRSGFKCLAFLTKRGEQSFRMARELPPYYSEDHFDWRTVRSLCEAITDERWGTNQRQAIRMVCEDGDLGVPGKPSFVSWKRPRTLEQLQDNISIAMPRAGGKIKLSLIEVRSDLAAVRRELDRLKLESVAPELEPGLNVVGLEHDERHIQSLVISSMIRWIRQHAHRTIIALPETWKFAPANRRTPVGDAAREFIREAAALHNFLWIDSQTLGGLSSDLLSQVRVWLFGVQRLRSEIEKTLDAIPDNIFPRPRAADIQTLKLGQFIVCFDGELFPVYVQPAWMSASHAEAIARGEEPIESARAIIRDFDHDRGAEEDER